LSRDHPIRGTSPFWKGGNVVTEGGVVDGVNKNTEEGGSVFARIGVQLGIEVDDECGGDSREKTSLSF
jgi:hypothetical protein